MANFPHKHDDDDQATQSDTVRNIIGSSSLLLPHTNTDTQHTSTNTRHTDARATLATMRCSVRYTRTVHTRSSTVRLSIANTTRDADDEGFAFATATATASDEAARCSASKAQRSTDCGPHVRTHAFSSVGYTTHIKRDIAFRVGRACVRARTKHTRTRSRRYKYARAARCGFTDTSSSSSQTHEALYALNVRACATCVLLLMFTVIPPATPPASFSTSSSHLVRIRLARRRRFCCARRERRAE